MYEPILQVLSCLFTQILAQHFEAPQMPEDFLELVACAVQHTRKCGRTNVIYNLSKALGTMRGDGSDSLLPARRMPMGLIEYTAAFFAASSIHKVVFKTRNYMCSCVCLCRFHAPLTTGCGFRVYMFCLEASSPSFLAGQCGVQNP